MSIKNVGYSIKKQLAIFSRILDKLPEIRYAGDPVLRQVAQLAEVSEGNAIGQQLGQVLLRYRALAGIGRGLAAPQLGISKAVFVTFVDDHLQTFINPQIVEKSKQTNFYRELCLSTGMLAVDVERPEWIVMAWTDEKGQAHQDKVTGFLARLYQHEEAHLRGLLNLDEAVPQGISFATFDPLKEQLRKKPLC